MSAIGVPVPGYMWLIAINTLASFPSQRRGLVLTDCACTKCCITLSLHTCVQKIIPGIPSFFEMDYSSDFCLQNPTRMFCFCFFQT